MGRTKNTISLRLWSAEVLASDFDLEAFNAGEHERAAASQADATKVRKPYVHEFVRTRECGDAR